ncbi:MAG: hypothetical protein JSV45_14740 [Chromatiales bacterium]|nr:MAG: hypothetical protein JSV45_14740 [Chromatiales bacterium]
MPDEADAQAERFETTPGTGSLYVVRDAADRDWASLGMSSKQYEIPVDVMINGRNRGEIHAGTYLLFYLPPGQYNLASVSVQNVHSITIEVEDGGLHFAEVELQGRVRGSDAQVNATVGQIDVDRGRRLVIEGQRVASRSGGER